MSQTILIVDDEPDILDTLKEAFEYDGYQVVTAPDGAAALQKLQQAPQAPCAAVLDVLMPKMDGPALYSAMKSDPRFANTSVIFCTSAPDKVPAGAMVMKKPIDLTRLLAIIHAQCPP